MLPSDKRNIVDYILGKLDELGYSRTEFAHIGGFSKQYPSIMANEANWDKLPSEFWDYMFKIYNEKALPKLLAGKYDIYEGRKTNTKKKKLVEVGSNGEENIKQMQGLMKDTDEEQPDIPSSIGYTYYTNDDELLEVLKKYKEAGIKITLTIET